MSSDQHAESVARLTQDQANIVTAYTGVLCGQIAEFHAYAEKLLERSIWTHEFADKAVWAQLKTACHEEFLAICCVPEEAT